MKGGMIMNGDFWQSFLMISDIYTVGFLILLCIFFGIIHYLYRKRKMDFSLVVLIGMGLDWFEVTTTTGFYFYW